MKLPIAMLFTAALLAAASGNDGDWPVYGHDSAGTKYSPLDQINRQNVTRLQVAWTFHTGDMYDPKDAAARNRRSNRRRCSSMARST
jgi:glucose dehydrogenase